MPKRKKVFYLGAVGVTVLTLLGSVLTFTFVQHHKQQKLQQEVAVKIERGMEPYTQTEEYTTETIVLTREDVEHLAQAVMPLITKEVADDTTGATREWTEEKLSALEEEIATGVAQVLSGNLVMKGNDPATTRYGEKLQNAITRNITMIVEDTLLQYIPAGEEESLDYLLLQDALEQNRLNLEQGRESSMKELRSLKEEIERVEKDLGKISEENASLEDVGELTQKLTDLSAQYTTLVNEYTVYKNVELSKEEKQDQELKDLTKEIARDLDTKAQESAKAIEENKEEIQKTGKQLEDVMKLMQESILVYQRATDEKLKNLGEDMTAAKSSLESLQTSLSQTIASLETTAASLEAAVQVNARQDEHLTNLQQALETNYLNVEQQREVYYTKEEVNETFQTKEEAAASTYTKEEIDSMLGSGFSSEGVYKTGAIILKDGVMYECITDIETPEEWNPEHWQQITLSDLLSSGAGSDSYREMILVALSSSGMGLNAESSWEDITTALTRWFPSTIDLLVDNVWYSTACTRPCFGGGTSQPSGSHRIQSTLAGNGDDRPYKVTGWKRSIYEKKIGFGGYNTLRIKGTFTVNNNNLNSPEFLNFQIYDRADLSSPVLATLRSFTLNGNYDNQRRVDFDAYIDISNVNVQGYIGFMQEVASYGEYTNSTVTVTEMYLQ